MAEVHDHAALSAEDLREAWRILSVDERAEGFRLLPRGEAEEFFLTLNPRDQADIIVSLPPNERRSWLRLLPPDDIADVIQDVPKEREALLSLLDEQTRKEVQALLAYKEDVAGGLMSPRYVRLRPNLTVDEAISYLRKQARERVETVYYAYVIDNEGKLVGVVSLADLFAARPNKTVKEVMSTDFIAVTPDMDQEAVSQLFAQHGLLAIPVVDADGRMQGIVTVDDIVDVVEEEATEDIQKLGGMEALDKPYFENTFLQMIKKRAGWLCILFLSEMLTASAMQYFEHELARALVLAIFIPLIISSGGNTGSQATTLIIRAMALGEIRLPDWFRVLRREALTGLALGAILGMLGLLRVLVWPSASVVYGQYYVLIALTVGASLIFVVMWGTLVGSMLPFLLRRVGLDPASASAPFVATLVDVSGLVGYFVTASFILHGTLL